MEEPFTMIPNRAIRSSKLDPYSFRVLCCIMSCGDGGFPSYDTLMKWGNMSRERVLKSLMELEKNGVIRRFKKGRKRVYQSFWTSSPDELIEGQSVRYTNSISSPDELVSVRQTNSIKN